MFSSLRSQNQSQSLFVRALSSAWRNQTQLYDPSVWLLRDPEVEEKMLRDADIRHAIAYRRHLIAGRAWSLTPSVDGSELSNLAVDVGTELCKSIKHFTSARLHLARAFFSGARFGQIVGVPKTLTIGDGKPRTWWVPVSIQDLDKRMFRTVPDLHKSEDGKQEITATFEKWNIANQSWDALPQSAALETIRHVYEDDQASLGHGSALREALGWWWYAKTHVFQESLAAVEKFARGIIHARVDGARDASTGLPNTEVVAKWQDVLEDMQSRHIIVSDRADEVEVISGSSEGFQLLKDIREELKATIYTLVIGANLTTGASEGGSYALAEIQENSTEALIQFDRETLEETLTDDLIGCIWSKNWPNLVELGIAKEPPQFSITQEKLQDPKERAEVAATLSNIGVELSLSDVLDQAGFKKPEAGEEVIKSTAGAAMGGFGAGVPMGGFGDGAPAGSESVGAGV